MLCQAAELQETIWGDLWLGIRVHDGGAGWASVTSSGQPSERAAEAGLVAIHARSLPLFREDQPLLLSSSS